VAKFVEGISGEFSVEISRGLLDIERVRRLRYVVLREPLGLPFEQTLFPGDEFADTLHVVGMLDGKGVGCLTLMPPGEMPSESGLSEKGWAGRSVQLRGMAVVGELQGRGVGSLLLDHVRGIARQEGWVLWCKAREKAVGFYESNGWRVVGAKFDIADIGVHYWMVFDRAVVS
jgi:GNAT superfamily N-acetyltransferase